MIKSKSKDSASGGRALPPCGFAFQWVASIRATNSTLSRKKTSLLALKAVMGSVTHMSLRSVAKCKI